MNKSNPVAFVRHLKCFVEFRACHLSPTYPRSHYCSDMLSIAAGFGLNWHSTSELSCWFWQISVWCGSKWGHRRESITQCITLPTFATLIPSKPLHNHGIVSVHFNILLLHGDLWQTKEELSYVHLHIFQCGWVLINIFYFPVKV